MKLRRSKGMENMKELKCNRCDYKWYSRVENPKACPNCKTTYWAVNRSRPARRDWTEIINDDDVLKLKQEVLVHYCKNGVLRCANPYHSHDDLEIKEIHLLSISRINGDRNRPVYTQNITLLKELKRKNYPVGYQVLCENCQMEKRARMGNPYI